MTEEEDKKAWKDFTENGRNLKDHFGKIKKEAQNKKDYIKPKRKIKSPPKPFLLEKRLVKKIAAKKITTDATLDLHGTDRITARNQFISFIETCRNKNYKYTLIITGKGKGLIRKSFFEWVEDDEIFPLIVGYSHAHRLQGGEGAFVLHLRKL